MPTQSRVALPEAAADALRSDLAGWTVDATEDLLGERAVAALAREQIVPARYEARSAGADPLAILTRVFMLGDTVLASQLDAALPACGLEGARAAGLVEAAGSGADDHVRALIDLRPYATADADSTTNWWIASDLGEAVTGGTLRPDHVLGVGGASATLASATMRARVGAMLDVGTGCGIQALHASSHSGRIVATDISRRALDFARFNRLLNVPHTQWDMREGSLLEPVAGESFDLVVSNPPFVITVPGAPSFEYRDGGHSDTSAGGDGIVRSLVNRVGEVLAPGGFAQLLGNWEIPAGSRWSERVEEWVEQSNVPLDAWIIQRDELDAAHYAQMWLRDSGVTPERDRGAYETGFEAYLRDFDSRGIASVGLGMIVLRRAVAAPTLRRFETHEGALPVPLGPHLAAAIEAHDWLAKRTDAEVLDERWTVAPDVTTESYARPGAADPQHILLRQGGAFGRAVRADTALAGFVGACDGELTGAQLSAALAALLDVEGDTMANGIAAAIRELATDGFLLRG